MIQQRMAHGLKPLFSMAAIDDDSDIVVDSLLFDVSYLAHRHAHALSRFRTADDRLSGHVYGVFKQVRSMCWSLRPKQLVFAYDRKSSWRQHLVPSYKQDRRPPEGSPVTFTPAPDVERMLRGFPGIHLAMDGAEADDMAAWFVANQQGERGATAIVSADRDLWQLVDDSRQVAVVITKKPKGPGRAKSTNLWIRENEVAEEFGVPPVAVARIKALLGDPSDCIDGLTGGSRPGKKEALRKFVTSPEADAYFSAQASLPQLPVPDWLAPELLSQRDRMLANLAVADLRAAASKLSLTPVQQPGDVAATMEVLLEFECESLVAQVDPFFKGLKKTT